MIKDFFRLYYALIPSEIEIIVTGKNPSQEIIDLCNKFNNVVLIPNPTDMNRVIQKADIYLCPIEIGGGLKLRIMDGLKCGLSILVHKNAAHGYEMFVGKDWFLTYDDKESFKLSLNNLIQYSGKYSTSIIREYYDFFSFNAGKKRLKKYLEETFL